MSTIIPQVLSILALLLGIANFIISRIAAKKDHERKTREDKLKLQILHNEIIDLIDGRKGYSNTHDLAKLQDAQRRIEQALAIDPNNPRSIEIEGHLYATQGNNESARRRFETSIKLDPTQPGPYNGLGLLSESEDSIRHFHQAINLAPEKATMYRKNCAVRLRQLGKHEDAKAQLLIAIQERPKYADAHNQLGHIYKDRKEYEKSRKHYELAISSDALDTNGMTSLGVLLTLDTATWDEGIQWLEHAQKIDPADSFPVLALAAVYADNHKPDQAIMLIERAISMDATLRVSGTTAKEMLHAMKEELSKMRTEKEGMSDK